MQEPRIVFCVNNHIYDKSQDDECPYCRQIEEKRKRLADAYTNGRAKEKNKRTNTDEEATEYGGSSAYDEEATEYGDSSAYDEEATEYGDSSSYDEEATEYGDSPAYDEEATEYGGASVCNDDVGEHHRLEKAKKGISLFFKEQHEEQIKEQQRDVQISHAVLPKRMVLGWLVCVKSNVDYGEIFTLREGDNYIIIKPDEKIEIQPTVNRNDHVMARIYRDSLSQKYRIEKIARTEVRINEQTLKESAILRPYSDIDFPYVKLIFYPLVGVYGFEWGQV